MSHDSDVEPAPPVRWQDRQFGWRAVTAIAGGALVIGVLASAGFSASNDDRPDGVRNDSQHGRHLGRDKHDEHGPGRFGDPPRGFPWSGDGWLPPGLEQKSLGEPPWTIFGQGVANDDKQKDKQKEKPGAK